MKNVKKQLLDALRFAAEQLSLTFFPYEYVKTGAIVIQSPLLPYMPVEMVSEHQVDMVKHPLRRHRRTGVIEGFIPKVRSLKLSYIEEYDWREIPSPYQEEIIQAMVAGEKEIIVFITQQEAQAA